jgi:N-carbamoyl-L-amino-acid hydrolase
MQRREFAASLIAAGGMAALPQGLPGPQAAKTVRDLGAVKTIPLHVDGSRLNAHLKALSEFGKNPQGGVSRVAYSEADKASRPYIMQLMSTAQLEVSVDAAGNILGKRAGSDPALKPILFGSHTDSVPEGGMYDGDVGSMGAIEVAQSLAEQKITMRHPLIVVIWQNEEGGLWGTHAATAPLTPAELATVSRSGKTIREGIAFLGGDPDHLERTRMKKGDIAAYLELHIEQGGTLEKEKLDIGVVEGIVGIHQWNVTIDGFQNHAGTTAMDNRHDALLSAARFIEAVNRVITSEPGRQVGTVGRINAIPGTVNVIPGKVECTLEIRDLDARKIDSLFAKVEAEAKKIGAMNGTTFSFAQFTNNIPAPTSTAIRAMVAASATELNLTHKTMPSGAGHDAQDVAQIAPVGMIFIPSIGGISHAPKEFSRPQDITNGANVLMNTLMKLDAAAPLPMPQ